MCESNDPSNSDTAEMANAQTVFDEESVVEADKLSVIGTRVDPAHVLVGTRQPAVSVADAQQPVFDAAESTVVAYPADDPAQAQLQAVQLQADQLAERLRLRHDELDRREGLLNAQRAEFDNELRSARLWLDERQQEFSQREASLGQRHAAMAEREAELVEREAKLAERATVVSAREQEVEWRQTRLNDTEQWLEISRRQLEFERQTQCEQRDRQRGELNDEAQRLAERATALATAEAELAARKADAGKEASQAEQERLRAIDERTAQLAKREAELATTDALMAESQSQIAQLRESWVQRHEQIEAQARVDRRRLAQQQRRLEAEWADKTQLLARQGEQLDRRRAALEHSRIDLGRLHRETLEMRLAIEELRAQLAGPGAPAALVRSLGGLRQRLTDHYRLESDELVRRRAELETLKAELVAEHGRLHDRQQELAHWVAQRESELNAQAERLSACEVDLAEQAARFRGQEDAWREERFGYQQEIRRLTLRC